MSEARTGGLRARLAARTARVALELELDTGSETLVVVGPNGAGKSTLLKALLGVHPIERGHVAIGDTVLFDAEAAFDVPPEERRLGYVPQDYALFPHLSVLENVTFGLASAPSPAPRAVRVSQAEALLRELGLEGYGPRRTPSLSGGEKQRVALARALSVKPRALLLDEPLAALDVHARREVRAFLASYLQRLALPTLVVTHDAADARALGGRLAVLEAGRLTQTGSWDELVARPASRFVESFISSLSESQAPSAEARESAPARTPSP